MPFHKECDVYSFYPEDDSNMISRLNEFKFEHPNYENLDWFEFDVVSVFLRNEEIFGFSSVWHRPEFYDKDEVRILNRYWEMPEMRKTSKVIGGSHLIEMIEQQISLASDLGFSKFFISRERSPKYFETLINKLRKETQYDWHYENKKVPVCNPIQSACWQYKASTSK